MESKKILLSRIFPGAGADLLKKEGFNVTTWTEERPMTQDELIEAALHHHALFSTVTDNLDQTFLRACPHLEIISQFGVGYDNIDIEEATRLGIPVGYTPGAMSDATADVAFGLMIAASRKMFFLHKKIIRGEWGYFDPNGDLGIELKHKTLGIIGMGRIGIEMARRCKGAFNMKIIYHNRRPNLHAEQELDALYVDFETLLRKSDVLSVHCALSHETRGLFNKEAFEKMKPSSIFINTSRGTVHNEDDLFEALKKGIIWGAGLDVTNPEPMNPGNELLQMENVAILPHIGSATIEARNEMARMAAENIIGFYTSKHIPHMVNLSLFSK